MTIQFPIKAVVLDIEGTTTPVTFVYDVLFPFARKAFPSFLEKHWNEAPVVSDIKLVQEQHTADVADGLNPPLLKIDGTQQKQAASYTAYLLWQMDQDRKTTGLKSLQGKIWEQGYKDGALLGDLFEDVAGILKQLHRSGIPIYIYSSGSIHAQKLLFGQTKEGDLLSLLSGHFDTTTGPKREAQSYKLIVESIGKEPGNILFATDVVQEADAAVEAGMQAVILDRPGNHPQPKHKHTVWQTLKPILDLLNTPLIQ